ncbi:MAG: AbrB family transcriptional regulator [Pseudomonadota bacterium]
MSYWPDRGDLAATFTTVLIGSAGAGLAWLVSFPVYLLTGPALAASLAGMAGMRLVIAPPLRDAAFLVIGIGIGTGVDGRAANAVLHWPVAFVVLAAMLFAILLVCRALLSRYFGFDAKSAVLAASPGHLSYVLGLGLAVDADIGRVAVVQSFRLLVLTLCVPFVAMLFGMQGGGSILPMGAPMSGAHLAVLLVLAMAIGFGLQRLRVPAALLIGAMGLSSVTHLTDLTPGVLTPTIALPCYVVLGTLIGTRFSGISRRMLRGALFAGLVSTSVTLALAALAAVPVALWLEMDTAHVFVAFAPGGLETMLAMGTVLGADPGFVAACHVGRLMLLTVLVPLAMPKAARPVP